MLWWVHVLPVALFTFRGGRGPAVVAVILSTVGVAIGESMFGAGYSVPAPPETVAALTVAVFATNLLIVAFASYARRYSRRLRLLFDGISMGILTVHADGRIQGANPVAMELLGLDPGDDVDGRKVADVLRVPGIEDLRDLAERGPWTGPVHVGVRSSGETIHALIAVAIDGQDGHYQLFLGDRSTEAMQQQELERQAKLSALGEALAGVAHELNNPLTSIMALSQLGQLDEVGPEEVSGVFGDIRRAAGRMRELVGELVGFARPAADEELIDVDGVLQRIVRVQRITLGKAVRIDCDLRSEGRAAASSSKIEQIVLNLISNAAYEVRRNGSVIHVTSRREGDVIVVEVRDDGRGISDEIRDRLFEPFATTKPEGEGTGLGLAISRRLARSWGGDLTARNAERGGAVFELRLPTVPATERQELPAGSVS